MERKVFMVMPFSDNVSDKAYEHCIKKVCDEFNLTIRRSDEIFTTNPVYDDIVREIQESSVIIVDISGKNPNVMYELGMAHILKQPNTIIITHDKYKDAPFDISRFRIIQYEDSIEGTKNLEEQLRKTLDNLLKDYKTMYKDQFDLTIDVMVASEEEEKLYALIGISQYSGVLYRNKPMILEGHSPDKSVKVDAMSFDDTLDVFTRINFVKIENNLISLTEIGKAFVESLKEKGFVCDRLNDQIFTENYVPFDEKTGKKRKVTD